MLPELFGRSRDAWVAGLPNKPAWYHQPLGSTHWPLIGVAFYRPEDVLALVSQLPSETTPKSSEMFFQPPAPACTACTNGEVLRTSGHSLWNILSGNSPFLQGAKLKASNTPGRGSTTLGTGRSHEPKTQRQGTLKWSQGQGRLGLETLVLPGRGRLICL